MFSGTIENISNALYSKSVGQNTTHPIPELDKAEYWKCVIIPWMQSVQVYTIVCHNGEGSLLYSTTCKLGSEGFVSLFTVSLFHKICLCNIA